MFAFDSAAPTSEFARCLRRDPVVLQALAKGGSVEDVVVALCAAKDELATRVTALELQTPRQAEIPGSIVIRGAAEHLLPS